MGGFVVATPSCGLRWSAPWGIDGYSGWAGVGDGPAGSAAIGSLHVSMVRYVWRIATDTPDYAADGLSGKGAERAGGRWNRKGTALIYTSTSIALASLGTGW